MSLFLEKNHLLGLSFFSKLNWGSHIVSAAQTFSKKIGALICTMKFRSPEVALYLCKSIIRSWMELFCESWAIVSSCYLDVLVKLQKRVRLLALHLLPRLNKI